MTDQFYFDQDLYDPLVTALEKESVIYSRMIAVIREKQDNIILGDLDTLRICVGDEQQLLQQAKGAEKHRKRLVESIAIAKNIEADSPTLVDLIEVAPEPYHTQLRHIRKQIHQTLNTMVSLNQENDLLLNTSLNHVHGMVQLFLSVNDDAPSTYTPQGTVDSREIATQVIDYRI
ncbi:MAG: flagellar protein FlgN [FCB group bacterium]|nr:flagellar protein FlgN [FCB group bacterium]